MKPVKVVDEWWIAKALRQPGVFAGITTPEVRRQRIAEAIVLTHRPDERVRPFETRGGIETYSGTWEELFAETYGRSLDVELSS